VLFLVPLLLAAKTFSVDGIVVAVDSAARTMLVSHRPIPKYMPAMTMPFRVERAADLDGLYPGARVRFDLVVGKDRSVARRVVKTADGEIPPPKEKLRVGDPVADFALTDQSGATVRLSDFRGKTVAIDFIYTRCPLPDVCPRLSASFAAIQRRFSERLGRDLVLLSVTVDPEYDTPAVLAGYAKRWGADPSVTSIVGRDGRLAAAVDGSNWRVDQLASLIAHELEGVR
jgi:protein SCO1/2